MKTNTFPVKDALKYGTPLVFICAVAWWYHALVPVAICFGVVLALIVAYFTVGVLSMIKTGGITGSRKPWIALLVVACLAAVSPLIFLTFQWLHRMEHRAQPEYALEVINQIRTPTEAQQHEEYFTPQGMAVYLWAIEQNGDAPMTTRAKGRYADPIIHGDTCDIGVETKDGTGTIRLLKTDHWRFHDFYVNKSRNKDVGLWLSYAKDHPYATAWTLLWR